MYVFSPLHLLNLFGKFAQLTTAASIGLLAYSGQGIYKSIYASIYSGTSKKISTARREEGSYLLQSHKIELRELLEAWEKCGGNYLGT